MEEISLSSGNNGSRTPAAEFSRDFAHRVVLIAQKKLRHRRSRNTIAITAAALLLASLPPVVSRMLAGHRSSVARDSAPAAQPGWQSQWNEEALEAYRLAASSAPRSAGDYLLPNAAALTSVSSAYDQSSWQ